MNSNIILFQSEKSNKYGITEKKKQELDHLEQQVLDAQGEVEQLQAIVSSLTTKSDKLQSELAVAENNKTQALNNKNTVDQVVDNAKDLMNASKVTLSEVKTANTDIAKTATQINEVINKLIYASEVVNKLSNLVIRRKAINPLISDELVSMVSKASADANNAVALTLVALESVFASQATTLESKSAMALELIQATKLYEYLIGKEVDGDDNRIPSTSIQEYLTEAYTITKSMYDQTLAASTDTTSQLNAAKAALSKAQVKLTSLQSGLAAANAAALAS